MKQQLIIALVIAIILSLGLTTAFPDFESPNNISFGNQYGILNASHLELNGTTITDWSQVNSSGSSGGGSGDLTAVLGSEFINVSSGTGPVPVVGLNTTATDARYLNDATDSVDAVNIGAGQVGASEIAATSVSSGSYGNASHVGTFTVDGDGRLTAATNTIINILSSAISDFSTAVIAAVNAQWSNLDTDSTDDFDGTFGSLTGLENVSQLTNDSGYITDYTVTEADVTAHEAALSITESQVSDLTHTTDTNETTRVDAITADCPSGEFVQNITDSGLECYTTTDTDTTYTNGSGINLTANTFSLQDGYKLPQSCSNGAIAEYNSANGLWECGADDTGGGGFDLNITGDSGSATITDGEVLSVSGAGTVSTGVSGNTITITGSSHTTDTNETTRVDAITADCGTGFVLQNITDSGLECVAEITDTDTQLSQEQVEDFVGGMLGGTETLIAVTYQDVTGDIDFVVTDTLSSFTNDAGFITSDTNNYTTSAAVTGTSTKTLNLAQSTGNNISASWTDLDTDTNANTICSGTTTYLDGEGNCDDISGVYQAAGSYYSVGGTDVALADGGTGNSLVDPNADRILFWDDSAGVMTWLTASTGLTVSGTSMTVRSASTSQTGIVELATTAETTTGTDTARAVTPDGLHDMTSLAGAAWFLDEDVMGSDSATKVASQQSIKAYVTSAIAGFMSSLVDDTTPQLGGDLDTNGNDINMNVSTAGNITGVGEVVFNGGARVLENSTAIILCPPGETGGPCA